MSWIAQSPGKHVGKSLGNGQSVSYVQEVASAPTTDKWKRGDPATARGVKPGTAIATFEPNNTYGNHTDGRSHAAIFHQKLPEGLLVWDQWLEHPVAPRLIPFRKGGGPACDDGDQFFVIEPRDAGRVQRALNCLLRDYLWITMGIAMFIVGGVLLAQGRVLQMHGRSSMMYRPPGTCEAVITAATSDGSQITLDNGWCSPVTLTVPSSLSKTVAGVGANKLVWFASDKDGALTSFQEAQDSENGPAGSCKAAIVSSYGAATTTIVLQPSIPQSFNLHPLVCPRRLAVPDGLTIVASQLAAGDHVWFGTDSEGKLSVLNLMECSVDWRQAAGAVALAFAVNWMLLLVVTKGHPWAFVLGLDCRLSNSQTQAYLWFIVLVSVYLAAFSLRLSYTSFFGGIGAPTNLLALAGISAGSFVGARASNLVQSSGDGSHTKGTGALGRSRWQLLQDLFTNDAGAFDLGDFQMIALTVAAVAVYVVISIDALTSLTYTSHVDLPQVDETLIGGTAVSQGAYLLKKFTSRLGN